MKDPLDIDTINFYYTQNMPKLPFLVHENIVKNINKNSLFSSDKNLTIVKKYYENLCDAYKIQTKILSNNNWDLSEYVGILSCYSANLIMNESMKSKKKIDLEVSPIFSKINYKFYNLKFVNDICKRLDINISNFQNFTFIIYKLFVLCDTFTNAA